MTTTEHILIVDDHAHIRRLLQLNLERAGYRVSLAADGVQALVRVTADAPDLIITDVMMPHMDGIELIRRLKGDPQTAGIPVLVVSVRSQDEDILEGGRSGADGYFTKPFHPSDLVATAAAVLNAVMPPCAQE